LSRFDKQGHELGPWRDDRARTLAAGFERRHAAPQSPHRIEGARQRRLAVVILAPEMPRQCAVIDVLADEAFAQELVDRTDGGLSADRIEQPFGRKSLRGEKSEFRRKPRREFGLLARAQHRPAERPMGARSRRRLGSPSELLDDPRHGDSLSMNRRDAADLAFSVFAFGERAPGHKTLVFCRCLQKISFVQRFSGDAPRVRAPR
jgi:hypothetical protein